ncbi:MAG: putative monovalent cation/H+ antiporter subunit A [Thioalkalivibrionaceae bacterium]
MLYAIGLIFLTAALAPFIHRVVGRHSGWVLGVVPAGLFTYFATFLGPVGGGEVVRQVWPWLPGLGIQLSFVLDGLSLLFALLVTGIGFFIVSYAGRYLENDRDVGRFFVLIFSFMGAMLGLVLADNLIALFVFWELTSITSYLLIGYHHEKAETRKLALQGLFVTVGGGLALLAGLILLAIAGGSYEISEILASGDAVREHGWYFAILLLLAAGAFTKSAQFPFHFWLPNAMAAPTPVSAYLHSATMVKAGVYLLARLHPAVGGTEAWFLILTSLGAITMLLGVWLSFRSTGVKKVLAYSTVMALGTLTMLLGIGTETAILAAVTFLLAHSLYKGALFLIAGILDHEAGAKDLTQVAGLRTTLPITTGTAILAALSLGGVLPLFGFVAKELMLEAAIGAPGLTMFLIPVAVATAMLGVGVALLVGFKPWFGAFKAPKTREAIHEAPIALIAGPFVLAALSLVFGLGPGLADQGLLNSAAAAVQGEPVTEYLALWHGLTWPLAISIFALIAGVFLFRYWTVIRAGTAKADQWAEKYGPERQYFRMMDAIVAISVWQTRVLQNGYLRFYVIFILITTALLVGVTAQWYGVSIAGVEVGAVRLHEAAIIGVLLLAVWVAITTGDRLSAVAALGVVGFSVALIYILFSAADVGITQVLVETLTVILLVLVLFRLPGFLGLSSRGIRLRDALISLIAGGMITLLILSVLAADGFDSIAQFFLDEAVPAGFGRNVVNVILVDFRALDTLGEIFVLALAAIGIYAMIFLRAEDRKALLSANTARSPKSSGLNDVADHDGDRAEGRKRVEP